MNNFCWKLINSFLLIVFVAFSSFTSNAQNTVTLECVNTDSTTGTYVQWSAHNCPGGAGDLLTYTVWATDSNGDFVNAGNTSNLNTTINNVNNPAEEVLFYITYECASTAGESEPSDTISNQGIPLVELQKVEVVGGTVGVSWQALDDDNVGGYVICVPNGANVFPIDTISDPTANYYPDPTADPDNQSEAYAVFAIDKCNKFETVNANFHSTVFLQSDVGGCNSVLTLSWTPYQGWDTVNEYIILESGLPIDTVSGIETTYEYLINSSSASLFFTIQAVGNHLDGIVRSNSNQIVIPVAAPNLPANMKLFYASIVSGIDDEVYLEFEYDNASSGVAFNLMRGVVSENDLEVKNIITTPLDPFTDPNAKPNDFSYYYRIKASDLCDVSKETNYARTMLLTHQDNFDQTITLSWNEFELESAVINSYELIRFDEINTDPTVIATFAPGDNMSFTDDVSSTDSADPGFYKYQVKANYNVQTLSMGNMNLDSYSNRREVIKNSQILEIPTAFRPNGINSVFKPEIDFPNPDGYSMTIVNRWGDKVFETTDLEIGWNGLVDGILAPQGVYAYVIKMESFNSRELIRKGTVLLVR